MGNSRAALIQQIFLEALEIPEPERMQWLTTRCVSDAELVAEVRSLLEHAEPSTDLLEQDLDKVIANIPRAGQSTDEPLATQADDTADVDASDFLSKLSEVGVLSPDEFASVSDSVSSGDPASEPRQLASQLVSDGKLTQYQASALLKGEPDLLIDKYLILDLIDVGGMGMVFKAIHRTMNRVVAVKMISQQTLSSADSVKRFQREVRVAATLEHPNIVRAYDADVTRGVNFLVMEYVRGDNLSRIVKASGPMSLSDAVDCIRQAAVGLQHAHERGIVHRDIKPGNLLRDERGTVKVLDLGLAHIDAALQHSDSGQPEDNSGRPHISRTELTAAGAILGTASFMAPEQSLDAHLVDHRSDIYSLGCTLYFLLTGETPYSGSTVFKVFVEHREAEIPSIRDVRPDVPGAIDSIFWRAVAKKPEDRFQSVAELIVAIDDCRIDPPARRAASAQSPAADVHEATQADAVSSTNRSSRPSSSEHSTRRRLSTSLLAAASVLAVVALGFVYWPESQRVPEVPTAPAATPKAVSSVGDSVPPDRVSENQSPGDQIEAESSAAADLIASGNWEWKLDKKLPDPINSADTEFGADIAADGLTIVVSSGREKEKGDFDLFIATRAAPTAPWSELIRLPDTVNTDEQEISPMFSDNGLTLSFVRRGGGGAELLTTRRASVEAKWSVPVKREAVNGLGLTYSLTKDRLTAFKLQRLANASEGPHVLRTCRRMTPSESFGDPVDTPLQDSGLAMRIGTLSNDGRLLFYVQETPDSRSPASQLRHAVYMVTRDDRDSMWSSPVAILTELRGVQAPRLQFGDRSLLCASGKPNGGGGRHDIYMARLVKKASSPQLQSPADLLASGDWQWQVGENLGPMVNSKTIEFGADMAADGRTVVFGSLREAIPPNNRDLWIATRPTPTAAWSPPVRLPEEVNTPNDNEQHPQISGDGLHLWFEGAGNKWMYTHRDDLSSPWHRAVPDPWTDHKRRPHERRNYRLTPNGLTAFRPRVVLSNNEQKRTDGTFMVWRRDPMTSEFGELNESILPGVSQITAPGTLSDDGRMYIFVQDVGDGDGPRQPRLFLSTRDNWTSDWSEPKRVFPNSTVQENRPRLLRDNRTLLFMSDREGGEGSIDIWIARLARATSQDAPQ